MEAASLCPGRASTAPPSVRQASHRSRSRASLSTGVRREDVKESKGEATELVVSEPVKQAAITFYSGGRFISE